ncbi:bile acid:sodium symporter family protein [Brachyspira catarrhinii]|uniref:Bile acid:sodium symporter family protein n=1 Tax=Brachyspira catarrhinii TaxID=2528966 RepID=A0ABY2TPS1_9SPIR|nr:bile acid:sodium symporter family protein [Brachyspira catarrhinii]TKZ33134.1 bile acid:sodium symporter family protein [Brachyspira catarrhinii]
MKVLKNISNFFGKNMAIIVLIVAALSLFFPKSVSFIKTSYVNYLLMIVMFGMGLTLKFEDFKVVFTRPKDIIIGAIAQFTIMPLLAFLLSIIFKLPNELAVGVILVGTCPGGTSSNVMTYLAKGDVALSVGMTSVSTILAPFATPLLTLLYAGQRVNVNAVNMFISIVQVVIIPIGLGFIINRFFHKFTNHIKEILPLISVLAIVSIVAAVVSANSSRLMQVGYLIIIVVMLHNCLGYLLGFIIGKLLRLDNSKCKAISIEVGMQNSGLATSLASTHFASMPLATIPGAIFSVWHNISGSIVANIMASK